MKHTLAAILTFTAIGCLSSQATPVEFDDIHVDNKISVGKDYGIHGPKPSEIYTDVNVNRIFGDGTILNHVYGAQVYGKSNSLSGVEDGDGYYDSYQGAMVMGDYNVLAGYNYNDIILGSWNSKPIHSDVWTSTRCVGSHNVIRGAAGILGDYNKTRGRAYVIGDYADIVGNGVYAIGRGLVHAGSDSTNWAPTIILGAYNKSHAYAETQDLLLVLGNGKGSEYANGRSNAWVVMRDGHTTMTHKNFIKPTEAVPAPAQPETLVVEGSVSIKGDLKITRRQGDIWMGSFGRPEDQGPSN